MRGRPPRGRPAVTPSNLMQEMQSCIEAIEVSLPFMKFAENGLNLCLL